MKRNKFCVINAEQLPSFKYGNTYSVPLQCPNEGIAHISKEGFENGGFPSISISSNHNGWDIYYNKGCGDLFAIATEVQFLIKAMRFTSRWILANKDQIQKDIITCS